MRTITSVLFLSLVILMAAIVILSFMADGQRAEQAGFFERAGIAADQLLGGMEE